MPVESAEYETFDYRHFDDQPLSLEEAIGKARELRSTDVRNFHRVVPRNSEMTAFGIDSIPVGSVYAELLNRWNVILNRFTTRSLKR